MRLKLQYLERCSFLPHQSAELIGYRSQCDIVAEYKACNGNHD